MTDMLEKVRRAIKDAWDAHGNCPFPLDDAEAEAMARAALEALREPTDAMVLAFWRATNKPGHLMPRALWQAMLDAALLVE